MSKYNKIKILEEKIDAIVLRINKEYPDFIQIPEHILYSLVNFIYDDVIKLIIECFYECGLNITEKDFIDNIDVSLITDRRSFIHQLSVEHRFRYFITNPINHFLDWSNTSFGCDVCYNADRLYLEKIKKIVNINYLRSKI